MAKVTDIQDKNGVSKEIQDKDLANRTSQTVVNSDDYVLLEDTNGAYHKIAKASFTEAVRGALGSVINSVAKGTDIAKVPVLDSNNDLGMGTLANLASVLGGGIIQRGEIQFIDYVYSTMGGDGTMLALIKYICANYTRRSGTGTTFIVNMVLNTHGCAFIHLYAGTLSDGKPQYGSGIYYTLNSWMKFSIDGYNYSESNL